MKAALLVALLLLGAAPAARAQAPADTVDTIAVPDTTARVFADTTATDSVLTAAASPAPAPPAARDTTSRPPAPGGGAGVVPADSLPSADAETVLRSIPEPLAPEERIAPADSDLVVPPSGPEPMPPDTTEADTSGVPIPELTTPLGERPGVAPRNVFADSTAAPPAAPATPPAAVTPPASAPPATPAGADTCWRLQIAAPADRAEAELKRKAAESQLLVPLVIETEQARHKVRSSCLTRAAAEALRARALDSGFAGSFVLRMGADGTAIPAVAPATPRRTTTAPARRTTTRRTSGTRR